MGASWRLVGAQLVVTETQSCGTPREVTIVEESEARTVALFACAQVMPVTGKLMDRATAAEEVGVSDGAGDTEGNTDDDGDGDAKTEGEAVTETDDENDGEMDGDTDGEAVAETDGEDDGETEVLVEELTETETLADAVTE